MEDIVSVVMALAAIDDEDIPKGKRKTKMGPAKKSKGDAATVEEAYVESLSHR
jgi:hypothetical protein